MADDSSGVLLRGGCIVVWHHIFRPYVIISIAGPQVAGAKTHVAALLK